MFMLVSDGRACGMAQVPEVRSPFETLEEALAQAESDQATGRTPLRIEDDVTQETVWEPVAHETPAPAPAAKHARRGKT